MFVPVYDVTPGDRYHSLVTRFLDFRASIRDEKTDKPALRRVTLQGWPHQGLSQIASQIGRSYMRNDIIIDADMSGGAYLLGLCILPLSPGEGALLLIIR